MKHNIGVKWYECPHCDHKAKVNSSFTTVHKASVHPPPPSCAGVIRLTIG